VLNLPSHTAASRGKYKRDLFLGYLKPRLRLSPAASLICTKVKRAEIYYHCSILLKFNKDFDHVTPDLQQTSKVKRSMVKVTAWPCRNACENVKNNEKRCVIDKLLFLFGKSGSLNIMTMPEFRSEARTSSFYTCELHIWPKHEIMYYDC